MIGAFFLFVRMRARRRTPVAKPRPPMHIQGHMVQAFLHPRMGLGCLTDSELQFGPGFRCKESPPLPHDAYCRCKVAPFSFTSTEVFNGALRRHSKIECTIPEFPLEESRKLIARLKALSGAPLPPGKSQFVEAAELDDFAEGHHKALREFLEDRYEFLRTEGASATETDQKDTKDSPTTPGTGG